MTYPNNYYHQFTLPLLEWYQINGRKELPWQHPREAYRVWVSEIMLQQTQVQTVIPYFQRFIECFPNVQALAQAPEDSVLSLWSGLGYYSRARNLHKTAAIIVEQYQGQFPHTIDALITLPGIGRSTAAAILSQAFDLPEAILDANVKRVLARFFLISGWSEHSKIKSIFWEKAQACMPQTQCANYTQAIMDLGALCCTSKNPKCPICPVQQHCQAFHSAEQHRYPEKKVKKPVPLHQQQFLILENKEGQIYLEKRPPTGIWGGLWCFPSIDMNKCPSEYLRSQYDLGGSEPELILSITHKFSHFHLKINALKIQVNALAQKQGETQGQWINSREFDSLGLAKPTQHILTKIDKL